jgi:hypothetical protein
MTTWITAIRNVLIPRHIKIHSAAYFPMMLILFLGSYASPSFAIPEADEKCGPDGYILVYNSLRDKWEPSFRKCARQGDPSSSDLREGDLKCGPDGNILVYNKLRDRWDHTFRPCR